MPPLFLTSNAFIQYRDIVIELFSKDVSVRKADVLKVFEERLGETIKERQFKTIMSEFATAKGNSWIFKPGTGANK